jgi:DNA-binding SARP family transcriptional activator
MIEQGRSESLAAWLDLLPPQLLAADPRLHYALGLCKSDASPRAARRHFEQAFERYRAVGDARGMVESCCGIIEATLVEFDDLAPLDQWTDVLDELVAKTSPDGASAAVSALIRALLVRDPGKPRLHAYLSARAGQAPSMAHAAAALIRGEFAVADALLAELKDRVAADAPDEAAGAGLAIALSYALGGQHARAAAAAAETLARAAADGFGACAPWLHAIGAAAGLGGGDLDGVRRELQALEAQRAPLRRGDRALLHYLRAWLFALEADLPASQREARAAIALAAETGMPWLEGLARIASAQAAAQTADWRAHEAQLRAAEPVVERLQSPLVSFALKLATAAGAVRRGDVHAREHVASALALGREHGLDYVPGWMPGLQAEVCAFALSHGLEREYAATLVRNRKLVPPEPPLLVEGWPWAFRVRTLGSFHLQRGSVPLEASGKGPARPMELLKVLIALGGTNVRIDQLADALWPHVDADYAHNSFTATLHRLRRLFGDEEALIVRDSRLSLNRSTIWVDIWALEQGVGQLDEALRTLPDARADPGLPPLIERLLSLYRGPFLADESEQPAYIACREQLRARVLRALTRAARCFEQAGLADAAIDCYQRFIEAEPLYEAPYRNLMLCYQRAGDAAEGRAVFERLQTLLAARLKSAPSAETRAVYAALESSGVASPRA